MDNDNKINKNPPMKVQNPEVGLFLRGNILANGSDRAETYNLEHEYSKSKSNRSWFILIMMLAILVSVGIMTVAITRILDAKNKQISVGIDVFEDLNLKKLLDVVTRTENSLNLAISEKSSYESEKQIELMQLAEKRDADLFLVQSMNLKSDEKKIRNVQIQEEYDLGVIAVEQKYDKLILDADKKIAEYQKQLSDLDGKNVAMAQEQKAAIDSQRQVFELEKQQLVDNYEAQILVLKEQLVQARTDGVERQRSAVGEVADEYQSRIALLDPVITNKQAKSILTNLSTQEPVSPFSETSFDTEMVPQVFIDSVESMKNEIADFDKVWAIVASVPQENSIPSYVKALKQLAYRSGTVLGNGALAAAEQINISHLQEVELLTNQLETIRTDFAKTKDALVETTRKLKKIEDEFDLIVLQNKEYSRSRDFFEKSSMTGIQAGFILSANNNSHKNSNEILIYLNPIYAPIADNLKVFVYRGESEYITTLILKVKNGFVYGSTPENLIENSSDQNTKRVQVGDFIIPDFSVQ